MAVDEIEGWLRERDADRLEELWSRADAVRRAAVGDAVHLRGLIEISNHCVRRCAYCGLNAGNRTLARYRMTQDEILGCVRQARGFGYGTIVLQGGEDPGITGPWLAEVLRLMEQEGPFAITLSLGERSIEDLRLWREAGADRYLLRFETSDRGLYEAVHPPVAGSLSDRLAMLGGLRRLGYEVGSGVMVGIPGQGYRSLAKDIALFRELDLDMVGVGPYLPHPATALGRGEVVRAIEPAEQVPNDADMAYKVVALTRLVCPEANIPATTALATADPQMGRRLGLERGANVIMPDLTPSKYRRAYEIYPAKAGSTQTPEECHETVLATIRAAGRTVGIGPGSRGR